MANPRSPFLRKGSMHPFIHLSIGFWLYTALQCQSSMSSNCLVFHTSRGISSSPAAFLFLIFLRTESSSFCVNGPSLMSNCLLIILVIGSCVIFGGFPSRFLKCCFHSFFKYSQVSECSWYGTKLHPTVRLQFSSSKMYRVTLKLTLLPRPLWSEIGVPIWVKSTDQIYLFEKMFKIALN